MAYARVSVKRLQVIEEDGCQELSKVVGSYLLERLSSLREEFECVGDVRGKGLMVGFEMVQDKACTVYYTSAILFHLQMYIFALNTV